MEKQQNVANFQETFVIKVDSNVAKKVAPFDRQELASAYLQLFSGFAWVNWTNKYSLGRAWQTALEQCGAFIETKNKKNPAAKYLNNVYSAHKKYWSRVIMTHDGRDNTINPDDKKIQELRAHGEKLIRSAMDKINLILARYNERVEELIATQAQEKAQMQKPTQHQAEMQTQSAQKEYMVAKTQKSPAMAQAAEQVKAEQNAKSVAQPAQQSGAFAMVRDTVKQPVKTVVDKPIDAQNIKTMQKMQPIQKTQKTDEKPIEIKKPEQKPMVQHMAKSVAAPVQKSGALPAVRNTQKQANVVKSKEIQKTEPKTQFKTAQQRIEINMAQQRAQMQMNFQRQIQMWQFGQFRQNAA